MFKLMITALLTVLSSQAMAAKYCGVVTVNGVKDYTYAYITDDAGNPAITGDTSDPSKIVKLIKDQTCYCVEGETYAYGSFVDFTKVIALYGCNGGKKIAPK